MATIDRGITIRPASTALLTIDSEDRFGNWAEKRTGMSNPNSQNYSPYNFSLIKNASLVNGYMTRLAVSEVVFPWTYPNINNQTNTINYSGTNGVVPLAGTIILPVGFYTPRKLADTIQTQLQAVFVGYAGGAATLFCRYGANGLPRFTFGFTAAPTFTFALSPMTYNQSYSVAGQFYQWNYTSTTKQLYDVLGLTDANLPLAQFQIGQATFAQAVRYIDIISPQLTANQGLPDATSQNIADSALCRLYVSTTEVPTAVVGVEDANFAPIGTEPFTIYRQFPTPKQIQWNAMMPIQGRVQFQVLDDNGVILPTLSVPPSGIYGTGNYVAYTDWSMTLLLTEN